MKVGDLVRLSMRKTRKGMPYDDKLGLVVEVKMCPPGWMAAVDFNGLLYTFNMCDLDIVSESR